MTEIIMSETSSTPKKIVAYGGQLKDLMINVDATLQEKLLTMPSIYLNARQLNDLDLLMNGAFSPLEGFLNERDYDAVLEHMRLTEGTLWPMPVVLDVPSVKGMRLGGEVVLRDEVGKELAVLSISSIYEPDKRKEALKVYGTVDTAHPGVKYLFSSTGRFYIGGGVRGLSSVDKYDFHELRHTPRELQAWFMGQGWNRIAAFQTRNPLHRVHFAIIKKAADDHDVKILLHPAVGPTKDGDIDYVTRVRCYKKLLENYMKDFAVLSLLPLAMRMAGPREAVWHAIVRKNYGCTHFIVGRDHAGPGVDSRGQPFYGIYQAQQEVQSHAEEIGISVIPAQDMVYVEEEQGYIPKETARVGQTIHDISGTEIRRRLLQNEEIPQWFSFPEIIDELRRSAMQEKQRKGFTIFLTGLPSSGKSTIANVLATKLLEIQDRKISLFDGDIIRRHLSYGLGFSREDRNTNIERIGFVAKEVTKHGGIAICAAIAPFAEAREKNREAISQYGSYIEAYVATPIKICRVRDPKGLYKKAEAGIIKGFTGVDDPYEIPSRPEIVLDASVHSPLECADTVISYLKECKLV